MTVYITGGTEGEEEIDRLTSRRVPALGILHPEDVVIVLGDFGLLARQTGSVRQRTFENVWIDRLGKRPYSIAYLLGEMDDEKRCVGETIEFLGGSAIQVSKNIFFMKSGLYDINGKKALVIGGGRGHGKAVEYGDNRPSDKDISKLLKLGMVDIILSHEGPRKFVSKVLPKWDPRIKEGGDKFLNTMDKFLENLALTGAWFFSHYRVNVAEIPIFGREQVLDEGAGFACVYDRVWEIVDTEGIVSLVDRGRA